LHPNPSFVKEGTSFDCSFKPKTAAPTTIVEQEAPFDEDLTTKSIPDEKTSDISISDDNT
jgi:hypothetical protein